MTQQDITKTVHACCLYCGVDLTASDSDGFPCAREECPITSVIQPVQALSSIGQQDRNAVIEECAVVADNQRANDDAAADVLLEKNQDAAGRMLKVAASTSGIISKNIRALKVSAPTEQGGGEKQAQAGT